MSPPPRRPSPRSYLTFRRALAQLGMPADGPGAPYRLYVADAPFAGHHGYGRALDALADQWDFWRELAALGYYWGLPVTATV